MEALSQVSRKAGEPFRNFRLDFPQNSGRAFHHDPLVGWAAWLETPKSMFKARDLSVGAGISRPIGVPF